MLANLQRFQRFLSLRIDWATLIKDWEWTYFKLKNKKIKNPSDISLPIKD